VRKTILAVLALLAAIGAHADIKIGVTLIETQRRGAEDAEFAEKSKTMERGTVVYCSAWETHASHNCPGRAAFHSLSLCFLCELCVLCASALRC
jgi:hypothetical protein